jgi:hypothetical protein
LKDNAATWRPDIEALVFEPDDHQGLCMVHRRAFRTLLRFTPAPRDCETYFRTPSGQRQAPKLFATMSPAARIFTSQAEM